MERGRNKAELEKLLAESIKLNVEAMKLNTENRKMSRELFWYPMAIATGVAGVVTTCITLAIKLLPLIS